MIFNLTVFLAGEQKRDSSEDSSYRKLYHALMDDYLPAVLPVGANQSMKVHFGSALYSINELVSHIKFCLKCILHNFIEILFDILTNNKMYMLTFRNIYKETKVNRIFKIRIMRAN